MWVSLSMLARSTSRLRVPALAASFFVCLFEGLLVWLVGWFIGCLRESFLFSFAFESLLLLVFRDLLLFTSPLPPLLCGSPCLLRVLAFLVS